MERYALLLEEIPPSIFQVPKNGILTLASPFLNLFSQENITSIHYQRSSQSGPAKTDTEPQGRQLKEKG